jgi:hypothetical protein
MRKPYSRGMEAGLVTIRRFDDELEANLAKSALQAARIDCMMSRDDCGGMRPSLSVGSAIKLLVRSKDADRAKEVLAKKVKKAED